MTGDVPGRFFVLKTADLGSLDTGTPIYFRRLQVGEVASYELDKDGQALTVKVFVNAPYDQYVTPNTRFWQASGIDVSLSASGLSVQTQSLLSILVGGIAFETPADRAGPAGRPRPNTVFTLFDDRAEAFKLPRARSADLRARLQAIGARARARRAGRVPRHPDRRGRRTISAQVDAKTFEFSVPVTIRLDAAAARRQARRPARPARTSTTMRRKLIDTLVAHGVRAQLRTGKPADRGALRGVRLLPRRAAGDGRLVAEAGAAADHSGRARRRSRRASPASSRSSTSCRSRQIGDDLRKTLELDRTLRRTARSTSARDGTLDNADKLIEPNSVLGARAGQHAPGGEPRGARGARARRLSRAPSRGAHSRQDRGGEVMTRRIAHLLSIALVARASPPAAPRRRRVLHPRLHGDGATARRPARYARPRRAGLRPGRRSTGRSSWSRSRRTASSSTSSTAGPRRSTTASRAPSPATSRCCSARRDVAVGAARQFRSGLPGHDRRAALRVGRRKGGADRRGLGRPPECRRRHALGPHDRARGRAEESFDALAAAHSRALAQLSGDIAAAIRSAPPARTD